MTDTVLYLILNAVISSSVSAQATVTSCFVRLNIAYLKFCCDLGFLGKDSWLTGISLSCWGTLA